ncbi:AbiTii domain-containing protein [Aeromonas caviae]
MPALLTDLINQVSDPTVTTADLLRKALVVARRLKQPEWAAWIGHELQGYPDDVELPPYRVIRCELKARNPFRGLIPIIISHPGYAEAVSTCRIGQSISGLEDAAIPGKNVSMVMPPEIMAMLMKDLNLDMEPVRVVGGNQLRALIDAVRDKLHAWALDLAEAGIEGDEIPSPPQSLAPVTIRIDGGIHGGQLMVSSPGGQQQQTVTGEQKAAGPSGLAQGSADAPRQLADRDTRQREQDTLKPQAATAKRKWPLIVVLAGSSLLAVLQGAGGGVLSELVLMRIPAKLNSHSGQREHPDP